MTLKLYTSRYGNRQIASTSLVAVRTSLGIPKWPLGFTIQGYCQEITPDGYMLKLENYATYKMAYVKKLEAKGVAQIRRTLEKIAADAKGDALVLLCYENISKPGEWCHRRMFAEWWEAQTGEVVAELSEPPPDELLIAPVAPPKAKPAKAAKPSGGPTVDDGQLTLF